MSSQSVDFKASQEDIFPELQKGIISTGHNIKTIVANQTIISEGKHEFDNRWMVILALFCWPGAIIYYFTSKKSILTITVTKHNETGCTVVINSNGKVGDKITEYLISNLQKNEESSDVN